MPQECKASSSILCSPSNESGYVGKNYLTLPILEDAQLWLEGCEWIIGDLYTSTEASKAHMRCKTD